MLYTLLHHGWDDTSPTWQCPKNFLIQIYGPLFHTEVKFSLTQGIWCIGTIAYFRNQNILKEYSTAAGKGREWIKSYKRYSHKALVTFLYTGTKRSEDENVNVKFVQNILPHPQSDWALNQKQQQPRLNRSQQVVRSCRSWSERASLITPAHIYWPDSLQRNRSLNWNNHRLPNSKNITEFFFNEIFNETIEIGSLLK